MGFEPAHQPFKRERVSVEVQGWRGNPTPLHKSAPESKCEMMMKTKYCTLDPYRTDVLQGLLDILRLGE
ncbi:hypothetical protein H5410_027167 [Solanum commersonii]|uniref:Uncharacterized protein n=1 Tax=Solanum commersonii TaxID=4109 RepID=A0A9J5YY97_SOLCO|nr:hypothetical protein H5410_027167 [Solanum commersonii]